MKNQSIFITGTDTGVGKTWMTLALMHCLQSQGSSVIGMKPVASGCERQARGLRNEDALLLQQQASVALPYERINPFAFEPAIAPHIAAEQAGVVIDLAVIRQRCQELCRQADIVLVEGVGGWAVPLSKTRTVADLAQVLGLPVILVVGIRLGCLNHALLSYDAIQRSGLACLGWIANQVEPGMACLNENVQTLQAMIQAPCLGLVPYQAQRDMAVLMGCLNVDGAFNRLA